jgi:hypothetical protein
MVVTYKVSYSDCNDSHEFSWWWDALTSVNNISFQKPSGVSDAPVLCTANTNEKLEFQPSGLDC